MEKREIPEHLIREIQCEAIDDYLGFQYGTPVGLTPGSAINHSPGPRIQIPTEVLKGIATTVDPVIARLIDDRRCIDFLEYVDRTQTTNGGEQHDPESVVQKVTDERINLQPVAV